MRLITARGLTVQAGGETILDHVDFQIDAGEIVTIVGPNGSGKSTLLGALMGLRAASGDLVRKEGLRVGYVPQKLVIESSMPMPVLDFLNLPRRHPRPEITRVLAQVGMQGAERRQISTLSGGQLQRVLLARALLNHPQLLVLDEPTQGLDQPGEAAFYRLIEAVRHATGAAVLMVSHDLHVVMSASDRVICLNRHVCCEGQPQVVRDAPEYRALFGHGTQGALALYQHVHDHNHGDCDAGCEGDCGHDHHDAHNKDPSDHA